MKWHKHDWRKDRWGKERHSPHVVLRWFHWSWRPRFYIHYWDEAMKEMRYKNLDAKECPK
jgi:hypothetical protein